MDLSNNGMLYPTTTLNWTLPLTTTLQPPTVPGGGQQPPLPCNDSLPPPPQTWSRQLDYYVYGVMMAAVTGLGLVGNSLAVMVLTRRTMNTSTNCFLTALAIWDSVVLLMSQLLMSLGELSSGFSRNALPYVIVYLYPVALVAQTVTVWLTVSFTVERYIAVCHPLQAASMCTIPRARIVIVVISVVAVLYNIPRWFEYRLLHLENPISNATCVGAEKTQLAMDSVYTKIYFGWLYFLVMCIIPLCSLAVLNAFLVLAVKRSQRQRRDMNVKQSRENNVTIMLVSVVMVFIVCQVPALIYNMAYAISLTTVTTSPAWHVLSTVRNFLVHLNSAVNFILYCALGQKFRRTFVRTFCPCIARRARDGFHSFTTANHDVRNVHHSSSTNGAVYIKLKKAGKAAGAGKTGGGGGGSGGGGGGGVGKGKGGLGVLSKQQNGNNKSSTTDMADQDSGVVVHKYSPRASVDSSNCDSALYLTSTGRGKTKTRISERSLLPKSRDDV
ncbi:FMRFamide receptor-like [Babylonia areolata]|uniref:FMRFamide receptor-like n=1 Tax=Babylonia areolata TaxID=304850 RepID=UPI003FD65357